MSNIHTLKPFQKGNDSRRNTKGRPKGALNRSNLEKLIIKYANKEITVNGEKMTKLEYVARKLIDDMVRGNIRALKLFLNYTEGKPKTAAQMARESGAQNRRGQFTDEDIERLKEIFPSQAEVDTQEASKTPTPESRPYSRISTT